MMRSSQHVQEPESTEPKDALVAAIHAIKALALPMMNTGCCQMRDPPHGQKEREQQAIQMGPVHNPTGFDVPTTAFAILKRCFHAHAPRICLNLSTPSSLITDEEPWLLTAWVPDKTDVRL